MAPARSPAASPHRDAGGARSHDRLQRARGLGQAAAVDGAGRRRLLGRVRLWLSFAGFPLEPSELSKLLLVVVLAAFLSRGEGVSWRSFGLTLLLVAPPAGPVSYTH